VSNHPRHTWSPPVCQALNPMMVRRYRLQPYIRTFDETMSLSLMECADRILSKAAHFPCTAGARFVRSRSDLSCHHVMIA
jgi:hypothetical protein